MGLGQQPLFEIDQDRAPARHRPPTVAAPGPAGDGPGFAVEVRTSNRRRKTATAYWDAGRVVVLLPSHLRGSERAAMVDWLVARVVARRGVRAADDESLRRRALELAARYVPNAVPASVRWVTNQHKRWGSCTAESGEIRISHHLQQVPDWVLDAVLVHELAERFPRHQEASSFLEGYALGLGAGAVLPTGSA